MSIILGLNVNHPDSSACLLIDGILVGAISEERLGDRKKHTNAFPINSIKFLMSENGVRLKDIDHIALANDPKSNLKQKILFSLSNFNEFKSMFQNFRYKTNNPINSLHILLGASKKEMNFITHNVEHHLAHISSSYYCSDFDGLSAGMSFDGSGDFVSCMTAKCEGNKIEVIKRIHLPNSLGHFYSSLCQFIGFDKYGEEYKVMGLAPYGEPSYMEELKNLISYKNGDFFLNKKFFNVSKGFKNQISDQTHQGKYYTNNLIKLLGNPRNRKEIIGKKEKDIAKSVQLTFEKISLELLIDLQKNISINNLNLSGGCALNGVLNTKIYENLPVKKMFIQPAASDDGTSIGAAYYCWHNILNKKKRFFLENPYLGSNYSEEQIRKIIISEKLSFIEVNRGNLIKLVSKMIFDGKVLGWFQGKSEWGPRALGNRSILASPLIKDMKDTINLKIKKRESFRPFAPSVLVEDVEKYFVKKIFSPFMMHVVQFKREWKNTFPSITHIDDTARIQTVDKTINNLYYELIFEFKKLSGHGIILNTSFNENEPIVEHPSQAISCFKRTDLDSLVMGNFIITKN